ncbi:MAG: GlsB/YeaQ/YmgE family stress response membrane protein [Bdellovibrionota bacterium]
MGIIGTLIIGFVIGLVARFLKPGKDPMGFFMTSFVGIGGAFLGTYLGQFFGIYYVGEPAGFIGAVVGAMIILVMLKAVGR